MLTTGSTTTNSVLLYWNEIRKWSKEDRSCLAELIEESLDEDEIGGKNIDVPNKIPDKFLEIASEYSIRESRAGRGIPHEQAMAKIKAKRGWK